MDLKPTERFSPRVADYVRYRPSYPRGVVELLARECGLTPQSQIADIGSGTGLLSGLFLELGCEVFGVEPNADMRRAGERLLADHPGFHSVEGRAESTSLPDHSVDFVTAGQSFHWFDQAQARAEFLRILVPGGWLALVWNERLPSPGFMNGYEDLVTRYGPERQRVTTEELAAFFGGAGWRMEKMPNQQEFDFEGVRGRFLSSSYAPLPSAANYEPLMAELRRLFDENQTDGRVTLIYETEVYFCPASVMLKE
jgi:SAM-dependent methyltransferase